MFEITLNGKTFYHPNSPDYNITNGVIHEKLNDAGYMDVTIPFSNPVYESIQERKGKIIVYKDNKERWYGEVRDISVDFSKNKTLYIVGELAYLNDSVQPQRKISGTKYQILQQMLNQHNSMCESDRQFQPGVIGKNANVKIEIVTDWEYSLDAIREHLCGDEEYIRVRHVNNVRYVDIMPLDSYGKRSQQTIMFGDNLLDYSEQSSGEKIATVCIPLGSRLEEGGIEGYENYLTCESANNGKIYVELPGAINRLGRITKVVHFNVLSDPKALVTAAINYLQSSQYAKLTLNLSAVDLSILHGDIDDYSVGDFVRAISEPMNMDAWFPVRERATDILNLANNSVSIGAEGTKSITAQNAESIDEVVQKIPTRDSILKAALKNASNLINANGENGNVSMRIGEDGKPYEILIMDADSLKQSTRAWRWNLNGFGHGTKKAGADEFTWEANVALTMDGEIDAEKGVICGFDINKGKTLDGELTDYLRASSKIDGKSEGEFIIGHKTNTGKSVLRMLFSDLKASVKRGVGIVNEYIYVYKTDLDGRNEKGTKIEPETITTDGDVYAYGSVNVRNGNAWYNLKSGIDAAAGSASAANANAINAQNTANGAVTKANAAQTTADNALSKANAAQSYAESVDDAQKENASSLNERCDALAEICDRLIETDSSLASRCDALSARCDSIVNLIHAYHPS